MESCTSFRHWRDPKSGTTTLRPTSGKCLHYYFHFIDERFGLCYVRVPTWAPFRLQACFNGHNWLARRLQDAGIGCQLAENAFLAIDDFEQAQALARDFDVRVLHRRLDEWAGRFCPAVRHFPSGHHWSIMQAEYATDILFHRQDRFQPLYDAMTRTAVHSVKADQVGTFLGRKLTKAYAGEAGNDFSTRIHDTRIRHHMGPASIKLHDKFGIVARVECTTNDASFFKLHGEHRKVGRLCGHAVFRGYFRTMSCNAAMPQACHHRPNLATAPRFTVLSDTAVVDALVRQGPEPTPGIGECLLGILVEAGACERHDATPRILAVRHHASSRRRTSCRKVTSSVTRNRRAEPR